MFAVDGRDSRWDSVSSSKLRRIRYFFVPCTEFVIDVTQISVTRPSSSDDSTDSCGTEVQGHRMRDAVLFRRHVAPESVCDSARDRVSSLRHQGRVHFDTVDQVTANDKGLLYAGLGDGTWTTYLEGIC